MKAFHNDPKIKEDLLKQLKVDYEDYENQFGIPAVLSCLKENIFELLPNQLAKQWSIEFIESINIGTDLSKVWPKFAQWILTDEKYGMIQYALTPKQKSVIQKVSDFCYSHQEISPKEWENAISDIYHTAAYSSFFYKISDSLPYILETAVNIAKIFLYPYESIYLIKEIIDYIDKIFALTYVTGDYFFYNLAIVRREKLLELLKNTI